MASIKKRGSRWFARYRDDTGREHGQRFDRKIDAQRWIDEATTALVTGQYVDPKAGRGVTVGQYARQYANGRPHKQGTARRTESIIRTHIEGTALGARHLGSVLPSELQGWVSDRAKVLAPSTLRQVVGLVRSVYSAAVVDRLVTSSPATRLTLPSTHRERVVPLTVDQVRSLAAVMAPRYWAMVIAQAALGLRLGELLALRVDDIDFLRRTVRVEHQVAQKSRELVPPKTPRSKRTVPLPKVVAEALAAHLAAFPATAPVGCDCPKMVTCSRSMSGLLFHTSTDHPLWHEHYGTRVFATAVKRAKLPAGTTSHDLRHHYASVLQMGGIAFDASLDKIRERPLPATSPFGLIMLSVDERVVTTSDQAIDVAVAMDDTMLHQIRLHRMPNRCIGCNGTDGLPRRFRSSARCRASGAGRLAIDPREEFARLEHRWLPVWRPARASSRSLSGWGTTTRLLS